MKKAEDLAQDFCHIMRDANSFDDAYVRIKSAIEFRDNEWKERLVALKKQNGRERAKLYLDLLEQDRDRSRNND